MKLLLITLLTLTLTACGPGFHTLEGTDGEVGIDGAIVRARALLTVTQGDNQVVILFKKIISDLILPIANAYTGGVPTATVTITYTNAEQVDFTLNTANLGVSPTMTGNTLNLGTIQLSDLDDNKLRVCSSPTKCQKAAIRVYTTGPSAGFRNITDGDHSAPVYVTGNNPTTAVGLTAVNSVETELYTIPGNKNRLRETDFTNTSFDVSSDFTNAGAGQYQMTLVIEYILKN